MTWRQTDDYMSSYPLNPVSSFPPDEQVSFQATGSPSKESSKALVRPRLAKIRGRPKPPKPRDPDTVSGVPQLLTSLFLVFLAVIAAVYLRRGYTFEKENIFNIVNTKYTLCKFNMASDCIRKSWLEPTHELVRKLFSQLNGRARLHYCQDSSLPLTLPVSEFAEGMPATQNNLAIKYLPHLISQNPQWSIAIIDAPAFEEAHFKITEPRLPLKCVVSDKITRFFNLCRGIDFSWIIFGLVPIPLFLFFYRMWQLDSRSVAIDFKSAIIRELIQRKWHNNESMFIIDHLREKLVPASNRSKYLASWNQALRILEKNYKRIAFGKVNLNGKVMRTISLKELY